MKNIKSITNKSNKLNKLNINNYKNIQINSNNICNNSKDNNKSVKKSIFQNGSTTSTSANIKYQKKINTNYTDQNGNYTSNSNQARSKACNKVCHKDGIEETRKINNTLNTSEASTNIFNQIKDKAFSQIFNVVSVNGILSNI